jgi:hypothetical protein
MTTIAVMRSAQSVLHRSMPREDADRIGRQIAERLVLPGNIEKAARRYDTADVFEIGELAAKEYANLILKQ